MSYWLKLANYRWFIISSWICIPGYNYQCNEFLLVWQVFSCLRSAHDVGSSFFSFFPLLFKAHDMYLKWQVFKYHKTELLIFVRYSNPFPYPPMERSRLSFINPSLHLSRESHPWHIQTRILSAATAVNPACWLAESFNQSARRTSQVSVLAISAVSSGAVVLNIWTTRRCLYYSFIGGSDKSLTVWYWPLDVHWPLVLMTA